LPLGCARVLPHEDCASMCIECFAPKYPSCLALCRLHAAHMASADSCSFLRRPHSRRSSRLGSAAQLVRSHSGVCARSEPGRCCAVRPQPHRSFPFLKQKNRSPRVRRVTFASCPLHIRRQVQISSGLDTNGSLPTIATPRMHFVFLGSRFCLQLPPHAASRPRSCCSARSS
jgi:hypothetical protein